MVKYPGRFLLLILLHSFGMAGMSVHAQGSLLDKKIFLENQSGSIADILSGIERAGELSFTYGSSVPSGKIMQIEGGTKTIREFLDEILAGIPVTYIGKSRKILIVPGPSTQSVRGCIRDLDSDRPLTGANIRLQTGGIGLGVISDTAGIFHFKEVPLGRCNLVVSYMGYQPAVLHDILVSSGKEVFLEVSMKERFYDLPGVSMEYANRKGDPKNDMAAVSARSFTVEESSRFPAAINDPARLALVFPGVTTGDEDLYNEMVIRGNSPSSVLWRMEGIEILVPNHFAVERSTTGWVNIIPSSLLGRSDFLSGAFPAEYGNTLGGVMDISLRNGNNRRKEFSFQFGTMGTELSAEGPFGPAYDGSYLMNFRYSTTAVVNRMSGAFEEEIIPRYWDICYKVYLPTRKWGSLSVWGLGGSGWADNEGSLEADTAFNRTTSLMTAQGLTHLFSLNERSYLKSVLSLSLNNTLIQRDTLGWDWLPLERQDFSLAVFRASLMYRSRISPRFSLKSGGVYSRLIYDYLQFGPYAGGVDSRGNTCVFQAFVEGKLSLARDLLLMPGLHYLYFGLNGRSSAEPRLGLKWNFATEQSLGLGIGMHSQYDYISSYHQVPDLADPINMPNHDLGLARAVHYVLSYDNSLIRNFHLKTEVYYQELYNIPIKKSPPFIRAPINNDYPMDTLISEGKGRNFGLEYTFEKYFSRGFYFLVSSSFHDSKIDPGNDTLYNTRYNTGHSQNIVGGKEFTVGRNRQNLIGVNAKMIWTGGNRGQKYLNDSIKIIQQRYERQYDDYFRIDVNFTYRVNRPRSSHVFSLDIQNVTNRAEVTLRGEPKKRGNIVRKHWNPETHMVRTDYQYGLFPFISYKVEF